MTIEANFKNINEYQFGDTIAGVYALDSIQKAQTGNGDNYLKVRLSDDTGKISGNIWDSDKVDFDGHLSAMHDGDVVQIMGYVSEYRDKPQLDKFDLLPVDVNDLSQELSAQLSGKPVFEHDEYIQKVLHFLGMMQEGPWKQIVQQIYFKYEDRIWTSPAAASMHHDMNGGLVLHTLTMAQSAVSLYEVYKPLYPHLNLDLMIAGALLHDVGKVLELSGPTATHYTSLGVLEGHIVICVAEITQTATELNLDPQSEEIQLLIHMILAHHLKGEWGSPVSPAFIEAQLLHHIDKIDADVQEFKKTESELAVGEFTNGKWHGIDGRVYRPSIHPED